ncbi:hypothetical protein HYC85_008277 [Camellia sinensis]|uniref:Uncharacterized protein n=1 Tax=Camellia sinensis TaxID=4442 RepID=A0A7J7HT42_CAMSI|nr:hypothetical protein HYC85_008277 [Camellia sinensis]
MHRHIICSGESSFRGGRKRQLGVANRKSTKVTQGSESGYDVNVSSYKSHKQYRWGSLDRVAMDRFYIE